MKRHTIPNTDLGVSALCYGTAQWGHAVVGRRLDELVNAYRGAGGNFIDTAHYRHSEPERSGGEESPGLLSS